MAPGTFQGYSLRPLSSGEVGWHSRHIKDHDEPLSWKDGELGVRRLECEVLTTASSHICYLKIIGHFSSLAFYLMLRGCSRSEGQIRLSGPLRFMNEGFLEHFHKFGGWILG